jgi:sarcosine oxidase subunit alpha
LLQKVINKEFDISNDAFPYMGAMNLTVCGIAARLFRVSFSGELAYELAVPSRYGDALIRYLIESGSALGAIPYGTEALGVMRIEKGHPAGNELNGQTTARDLGLARMMSTKKDFIGRVMSQRPALMASDRPALAGFRPVDRSAPLTAGAHFLPLGATASAENDQGFMSSVASSPLLGHAIGLGFIRGGQDRIGEHVRAYDPVRNLDTEVEICHPVFWDLKGERLRA